MIINSSLSCMKIEVRFSSLIFLSSPEPKAQVSFSDQNLSVDCCCGHRKLFTFSSSSQEPLGQFQPNLAQIILWVKGIQLCSNEGSCPFPRGNNYKIAKIH